MWVFVSLLMSFTMKIIDQLIFCNLVIWKIMKPQKVETRICSIEENMIMINFPYQNCLCIYLNILKKKIPSFVIFTIFFGNIAFSNACFHCSLHFIFDNFAMVAWLVGKRIYLCLEDLIYDLYVNDWTKGLKLELDLGIIPIELFKSAPPWTHNQWAS